MTENPTVIVKYRCAKCRQRLETLTDSCYNCGWSVDPQLAEAAANAFRVKRDGYYKSQRKLEFIKLAILTLVVIIAIISFLMLMDWFQMQDWKR